MEQVNNLFRFTTKDNINELRYNVPKTALQTRFLKHTVKDYAQEIIKISEEGLKNISPDEISYLDNLKEYTFSGITPADIIIKNWYGIWDKDINKLIAHITNK